MKRPDGYLPREGDVINLTATVRFNFEKGDSYVFAKVNIGSHKEIALDIDEIDIRKFNLRIGEWVRLPDNGPTLACQVIAVHEGWVWIKDVNGELGTFVAECLEPCDDPTKQLEVDMNAIADLTEPRPIDRAVDEAMQEPPPPPAPEPCEACGAYHPDHMLCPPESPPTKPRAKKPPPGFDGDEEVVF